MNYFAHATPPPQPRRTNTGRDLQSTLLRLPLMGWRVPTPAILADVDEFCEVVEGLQGRAA